MQRHLRTGGNREHRYHLGDGQDAEPPAVPDVRKEPWFAGGAEREDEQRECDAFQVRVKADARLTDDERGDQRATHASGRNWADADRGDQMSGCQACEQCDLRLVAQ